MTDTRKLVEKLSETALLFEKALALKSRDVCLEAADTITALSERVRVLEEALRLIADIETPQAQVLLIARAALTSGGRG